MAKFCYEASNTVVSAMTTLLPYGLNEHVAVILQGKVDKIVSTQGCNILRL